MTDIDSTTAPPVIAEVVRSDFVESRHRGSVVVLDTDGSVAFSLGDTEVPFYARSSNKPLQAVGMLGCGLDVPDELLALVTASHSGEDFHVAGVERILDSAGLDASALQCPPSWPLDAEVKAELLRAGEGEQRIRMNCSGKHAGMVATCVAAGWPTETYLEPDHPLQKELATAARELTGDPVEWAAVDGCGAPLFPLSLTGLARAFRRIAVSADGTPEHAVARAIRGYPTSVSGTSRDEAKLIAGVPGLIAKGGAEAAYAVALPDGRAVATKIEDGNDRARSVVMATVLRGLGVDAEVLAEQSTVPVLGGGRPVGEIRAAEVLSKPR